MSKQTHELEAFISHCWQKLRLSPNTVTAYERDLEIFTDFLLPYFEGTDWNWCDLDVSVITAFGAFLKERRGYKETTICRRILTVKRFLEWLCPATTDEHATAKKVKRSRAARITIRDDDIQRVLKTAGKGKGAERDVAILMLMYSAGLQINEIRALKRDDLNSSKGTVRVRAKRRRRGRILQLDERTVQALKAHLDTTPWPVESAPLFINKQGHPLSRQTIHNIVKRYMSGASSETLRHSFARRKIEEDTDLRALQKMLGHRSLSTTASYVDE